jgi:integrase
VLARAVEKANVQLAKQKLETHPTGLTPHSLRRTFASLLFAVGENPPYVMAQLGHIDPQVTLGINAKVMDRRDGEPERLKALVEGPEWVATGSSASSGALPHDRRESGEPVESGVQRP